MAEPFLGEIRLAAFSYAPRGWALCNGQTLPITQNQALFSLLGITFGGDGRSTFGLPDLRGRVPMQPQTLPQGAVGGEDAHLLTMGEMPGHIHQVLARDAQGTTSSPANAAWGQQPDNTYTANVSSALTPLSPGAIAPAGGGQAHQNWSPYLVLNFIIALQGVYPSRP